MQTATRCTPAQVTTLNTQKRIVDASALLTPLKDCRELQLTNEEQRKGSVIFRLPVEITNLDTEVLAVCEPAGPWQWLPVGALLVYNTSYEWEDDNYPAGEQLRTELATRVGRLEVADRLLREVTFQDESGTWGTETWPVNCLREMWSIGRTAIVKATSLTQAA